MTFAKVHATQWVTGEPLEADQINTIDLNLSRAVDGYAGGDVEPSSPIVFKADAVQVEVDGLEYQTDAYPKLSSRTIYRTHHIKPLALDVDQYAASGFNVSTPDWRWENWFLMQDYVDTDDTNKPYVLIPFEPAIPYGTLTTLSIKLKGASAHSDLPQTMPLLALFKSVNGGNFESVGSASDDEAHLNHYEEAHVFGITGLTETIDADSWTIYLVKIQGEAGTNAVVGNYYYHLRAAYTVDTIHP